MLLGFTCSSVGALLPPIVAKILGISACTVFQYSGEKFQVVGNESFEVLVCVETFRSFVGKVTHCGFLGDWVPVLVTRKKCGPDTGRSAGKTNTTFLEIRNNLPVLWRRDLACENVSKRRP